MYTVETVTPDILKIESVKSSRINPEMILNITGVNNTLILGEKSRFMINRLEIIGSNNTIIIGDSASYKKGHVRVVDDGQTVSIGKGSTFERCNMICAEGCNITIGDNCMVSWDVVIRTTDSHSILDYATKKRVNYGASVSIGDHVWIGAGVIVGKGASVANDCIIGTRSFVNRPHTEEHCILAGTPAKIVKTGVTWDRERLS